MTMAKKRFKRGEIVEVIWNDTNIAETGWMSEEEHAAWVLSPGGLVRTVGIFVSEDRNFMHLVGDTEADSVRGRNYLRPINVGKGFIVEVHKLVAE